MKKIKKILFIFIISLLLPLGVSASDNAVYWRSDIGGSEENSLKKLFDEELNYSSIRIVEFDDISSTGNTINKNSIDISKNQDRSVMLSRTSLIVSIQFSGTLYFNSDSSYLFKDLDELWEIQGLEYVNTSKVTNMSHMFHNTFTSTNGSPALDLSNFDTSNVTNMSYMFYEHSYLVTGLDKWDTSNVTNMAYMFYNKNNISEINLSGWNTSNVTDMSYMFARTYTEGTFDLSTLNTSNVTNMSHMFNNSNFHNKLDLSNFDTSSVTDMSGMFNGFSTQEELDISNFDTSKVTNMSYMFASFSCKNTIDLSKLDTSKATDMSYMFYNYLLSNLDVSTFDTSNVTNMSHMFSEASKLLELDLSSFNTSKVTNMAYMFSEASNLSKINLSTFDTSNVTNMAYMFSYTDRYNFNDLRLDLKHFNTSKVTNMAGMFQYSVVGDISNFDTSKVTNMSHMFESTTNYGLNLSKFNTSKVTNMSYMFYQIRSTSTLDLSSFDTSNVTDMSYMFYQPNYLGTVYVSNKWTTASVTEYTDMFYDMQNIVGGVGTKYSSLNNELEYARIDSIGAPGYFSLKMNAESDTYEIGRDYSGNDYIYLDGLDLDVSKIKFVGDGTPVESENYIDIYYDNKIVKRYPIIKLTSDEYIITGEYIYSEEIFNKEKINPLPNISFNIDTYKSTTDIYFNNKKIDTLKLIQVTSDIYDMKADYFYLGTSNIDCSKIYVTYGSAYIEENQLIISYNKKVIKTKDVIQISSDEYQITKDYIYTGIKQIDKDKITVPHANITIEDNQVKIIYKEQELDSFDIVSVNSTTYDIQEDYIYLGIKDFDESKINVLNGTHKNENHQLKIYYNDIELDNFNLIKVSSDIYDVTETYIYIAENDLDFNHITATNAQINTNYDNTYIYIIYNNIQLEEIPIMSDIRYIELSHEKLELDKKIWGGYGVGAQIYPYNILGDTTLTWSSSDESVATVSQNGSITPINGGVATITVTSKNGKSDSMEVVVFNDWLEYSSGPNYKYFDGEYHTINLNIKTPNPKVTYSTDGINYNLTEMPKYKNPGEYKIYYKITADYYEERSGCETVKIIGLIDTKSYLKIKNNYVIVNNFNNKFYNLITGFNMFLSDNFREYRLTNQEGGIYHSIHGVSDDEIQTEGTIQTGNKFHIYIDTVVDDPKYSYDVVLKGDLSGDGDVDSLDLATMLNHISGKKEAIGAHLEAAYLNEDEDIDSLDLAYLMNHIAGKEGY